MKKKDYTFKNSPKRSQRRRRSSFTPVRKPGYRSARLSSRQQEKRRRLATRIMLAGIVFAVLIFLAVFLQVRSRGGSEAAPEISGGDGSGTVIITGSDESGGLSQLALMVPEEQGGFSLYTIPARTIADTPGFGFQQLDRVIELGGQQLLDQTVANLLQVPIQFHIQLAYPTLEIATEQAGSINFRADRPLAMAVAGETINLAAGDNPTGAQRAVALLKASSADGQTGPKIQTLFYQGLRDSLSLKSEADRRALAGLLAKRLETDLDEEAFVDLFLAITTPGRSFGIWPLPVRIAGAGAGAGWYLEPLPAEIEMLMTGNSQDAAITLEIHNGTDTAGIVEAAAERLAALRYSTSLQTDPSGVDFDNTQIRVGSEALAAGARVRDILGKGIVIKDEYMGKRQITVIIGRDISLAELEKR